MVGEIEEIGEIKGIIGSHLKHIRDIDKFVIIFARRDNGNWKVVVRYATEDNPDTISMLMVNIAEKRVEYFRENIPSY
ncbi:MAG TPA: hypothetical protein VJH95_03150 [Candidatus Nanoarchaeia archaeon]|nr:hypothetical protein [Candidatus Nanoarchaeia archaeon]